MFKATQEVDNLVFKQEINYIKEQASQRSYENLEKILEALEKTKEGFVQTLILNLHLNFCS